MEIKQLGPDNLEESALVVAAAFKDSNLYKYIEPSDSERLNFLKNLFTFRMRFNLKKAEVYGAFEDGELVALASWAPPGVVMTREDMAENGGIEMIGSLTAEVRERYMGLVGVLSAAQSRYIQQPYWGLAPMVVLPEMQGRGIATKLLHMQLEKIDAQGVPCFLDTQDKKNVEMYKKYSFKLVGEDEILNSGLINYAMVR